MIARDHYHLALAVDAMHHCKPLPPDELSAAAEALVRVVSRPDLGDSVPCYVVCTSALPDNFLHDSMRAATLPDMCWMVRDHVPGWRGPGPTAVLNDASLAEFGDGVVAAALCFTIHEMGHALPQLPWILAGRMSRKRAAAFTAMVKEVAQEKCEEYYDNSHASHLVAIENEWKQHEPLRFLRPTLHLLHRARVAGFYLPLSRLVGAWECATSPYGYYALLEQSGEFERLAGATVRDILETDPPDKYLVQAAQDKAAFLESLAKLAPALEAELAACRAKPCSVSCSTN